MGRSEDTRHTMANTVTNRSPDTEAYIQGTGRDGKLALAEILEYQKQTNNMSTILFIQRH